MAPAKKVPEPKGVPTSAELEGSDTFAPEESSDEDELVTTVDTTTDVNNPSSDKVDKELSQVAKKTAERSGTATATEPLATNRNVAENARDLDALADTGPNRQGNAYGVARDAVENFRRDAEQQLAEAEAEVERLLQELEALDDQLAQYPEPEVDETETEDEEEQVA